MQARFTVPLQPVKASTAASKRLRQMLHKAGRPTVQYSRWAEKQSQQQFLDELEALERAHHALLQQHGDLKARLKESNAMNARQAGLLRDRIEETANLAMRR